MKVKSLSENEQTIVMNNVRRLMKQNDMKNSMLESKTSLGLSAGYISKLNRHAVDLSYKMVHAFADLFGVTADYLLFDFEKSSFDVSRLHSFFDKIFMMAKDDKLYWTETKEESTYQFEDSFHLYGPIMKELCIHDPDEIDPSFPPHVLKAANEMLYGSLDTWGWLGARSIGNGFLHNDALFTILELQDSFFQTEIDTNGKKLFLYKVLYLSEDMSTALPNVVEAYIQNEQENYYLCSTLSVPSLSKRLNDLYQIARDSTETNRLQKGARELIDKFIEED